MISEVRFRSFRCLRDVCLPMGRVGVLVGKNGVGKTAVLEGLHGLLSPEGRRLAPVDSPTATEIEVRLDDGRSFGVRERGESASFWFDLPDRSRRVDLPYESLDAMTEGRALANEIDVAGLQSVELVSPHLDPACGIADVLQRVRDEESDLVALVLAHTVPSIQRVRWGETDSTVEVKQTGVGWTCARHLSEGTLLALRMIAAAFSRPRVLLVDDLGRCLHPQGQRKLTLVLRDVAGATPDMQLLVSTHSPLVVDEFDSSEVFVLGRDVRRLSEHPRSPTRDMYMRAGELWSLVGEDWTREGPGAC